MGIQFKIIGGTPKAGKSLCHTCKNASIVRGQNCEEVIRCNAYMFGDHGIVRFKVAECASYHPVNVPWLHEMKEMAWNIEARKRGPSGFQPTRPEDIEVIVTPPKPRTDNNDDLPDF